MAEVAFHDDVVEEILIRLDAKDLNRYKRVCKSWRSLITSPGFVSRHLNHSYNKDHYNNQLAHRKVSLIKIPFSANYYHLKLVGSSNGLVCIFSAFGYKLVVGNPLTREVRQLTCSPLVCYNLSYCWGFGYDLSKDDYKVIVGEPTNMNQTYFWILSLKSNVWRCIGDKKVSSLNDSAGILCNGALHWIMMDKKNNKKVIICYDLSKEEFKEILIPEGASHIYGKLGILKECLCLFGYPYDDNVWLMKKYNVNESWERVNISHDREMKHDIVHWLRLGLPKDEDASWFYRASEHLCWEHLDAPVYVQSLVSPHDNARGVPKTKCPGLMPVKPIPHVVKIKSETEHVHEVVKESEAVEEVKIEKSESDHSHVQEVANESEIVQAVAVLTERKDLEAPELVKCSIEQIQEAVEVSIEKEDLGGPQLEKQSIEHTHEVVEKSESVLTVKDLGTPELEENLEEQIKEVMKEPDTVLTIKRILVDSTWERNHTSPWFKKMKPDQ